MYFFYISVIYFKDYNDMYKEKLTNQLYFNTMKIPC